MQASSEGAAGSQGEGGVEQQAASGERKKKAKELLTRTVSRLEQQLAEAQAAYAHEAERNARARVASSSRTIMHNEIVGRAPMAPAIVRLFAVSFDDRHRRIERDAAAR